MTITWQKCDLNHNYSELLPESGEVINALDQIEKGEFNQAVISLEKSFDIFQWGINRKYLMAQLHTRLGNYEKALEYYEKAMAAAQESNNTVMIAASSHNLGRFFEEDGDYENARRLPCREGDAPQGVAP